jgi:hypothetical protein
MQLFLNDPKTGKPDEMVTLTVIVTLAVVFRFLVDGLTFHILGQIITFSKLDAMVYISLLTPVLGTHGFIKVKNQEDKL